jgi:hypothetical protein
MANPSPTSTLSPCSALHLAATRHVPLFLSPHDLTVNYWTLKNSLLVGKWHQHVIHTSALSTTL